MKAALRGAQLAAAKRHGGNSRAAQQTRDRLGDVRLGAVEQFSDFGKRQKIKIT
jgi:hypothetical protein